MTDTTANMPAAGIEWFADIAEYRKEPIDVTIAGLVPILDRMQREDPTPTPIPPLTWRNVVCDLQQVPEDGPIHQILVLVLEPFLHVHVTGRMQTGPGGESLLYGVCCYPEEALCLDRCEVFAAGPGPDGNAIVLPQHRIAAPPSGKMIPARSVRSLYWTYLVRAGNVANKWRSTSRKNRRYS